MKWLTLAMAIMIVITIIIGITRVRERVNHFI